MITKAELRKDQFLESLTDEMLEKFVPVTEEWRVEAGEIIFNEGDPADNFFMVKSGKILLEQKISEDIIATVGTVDPGESFGLSVLLYAPRRVMTAICSESAIVYAIHKDVLLDLMDNDHSMGYFIMKQAARVLNTRVILRTEQFLRSMHSHPDIHELETDDTKV
ncbi:Cyclic nucleotide-binding domain-containing protein [Desulfocicer vacuolatum DSM 3385]|uniref:Cyclic nucleotide-binding domain-containing protein n=1 Tax=Desulfocicer vacuolatum DSM 3385 TaxID=1121400 RepID=A0A1W1Z0Y9_9BACT|nr:Crp/Fnr family transcriptional regulator [Desulfocicer vacuolatum]SMC42125.1 Cyclic nucleotide-binding domain-containing protein [Desulfocicer vacuolatum DSM 3385]